MSHNAVLDARNREATLGRLTAERFDLVIIGGGITGAGAALDAATRGLRVALIESRDLASGTSSRSSKLIHGGCATWSNSISSWSARHCTNAICWCPSSRRTW